MSANNTIKIKAQWFKSDDSWWEALLTHINCVFLYEVVILILDFMMGVAKTYGWLFLQDNQRVLVK